MADEVKDEVKNPENKEPENKEPEKKEEQKEPEKKEPENKEPEKKEPEKKEPEKKEEEKKEPENKENEEIADLKAKLEKLQGELDQANDKGDYKVELDQVNALLKVQKDLVSEYEGILTGLIDAKMEGVPENIKDLVPANLSLKERLDWLNKAEKSGIFKTANPDIEIGKPLNPKSGKQETDPSKLSASTLMSMAYGNSKGKGRK